MSNVSMDTILVIDDDEALCQLVQIQLKDMGYNVDIATDGKSGLEKALTNNYSLIILDLNLPQLSGLEVCKGIRNEKSCVPIIILSSRDTETERVVGLELGADDYVTKPFGIHELKARVRARLRAASRPEQTSQTSQTNKHQNLMVFGELSIDQTKRRVTIGTTKITLTAKEFDLLAYLAANPGQPFTRDELLEAVWGLSAQGYEQNVNALIIRIRKKIETDPANPKYIQTERGVGYKFIDKSEL